MIRVEHLSFEYPRVRALDRVTFTIPERSITALVGPNGAGKTTLLNCMAGLKQPFGGKIFVNGLDVVATPRKARRHIGFLPDFFGLYDNLTLFQCLTYFALAQNVPENQVEKRVSALLERLNLADKKHEKITGLSRGMRQRLAIGQAMIHDPDVLLLDEPASGLDPEARNHLAALFLELNARGKTLVVSSHILSELDAYANDLIILKNGRVVAQRPADAGVLSREIEIHVSEPPAALGDALARMALVQNVRIKEGRILVTFSGDEAQQARLLGQLVAKGVAVTQFFVKKQGLEDQYLRSVGKGRD